MPVSSSEAKIRVPFDQGGFKRLSDVVLRWAIT